VPETQAVFCRSGRQFGEVPTLSDEKALAQFLEQNASFPVYSKPINGVASLGNFLIEDYRDDSVVLADGDQVPVAEFVQQLEQSIGQLFQSVLLSNEDLSDVCGRVSTVRVILIIRDGKARVLNTVWKIPSASNIADNFWRAGNRLASVNPTTGRVERAVAYVDNIPTEIDPSSTAGASLIGRQLPDWQDVLDVCQRGAHLFSGLYFQGWDIALTDRGPVVVEVNPGSSFILSQTASGKGFLTDEFYEFIQSCGYPLKPFK
jgi:tetrahydromethanopterin S-methyltransferase subunit B